MPLLLLVTLVTLCHNCLHLLVTPGHIGSHLSTLVTPSHIWSLLVTPGQTCPIWSQLVTPGLICSQLVTSSHN